MREFIKKEIDSKLITLYKSGSDPSPAIYVHMSEYSENELLDECEKLSCPSFDLVTVSNIRWDEELSPWKTPPIVSKEDNFTGEADDYCRFLTRQVLLFAEQNLGSPSFRVIAGYSMGGLFALYAPFITDVFSRAVSVSGSAWYPDFVSYTEAHDFPKAPDSIYLSLGNKESRTRNQYLSKTEDCTQRLLEIYQSRGINSVFELNEGNHFRDECLRMAKGIKWILNN